MIIFPGRHLMGVLECQQLTPPNNMVELKNPWAVGEKSGWIHGAIRVSRCRFCGIFFPAKPTMTPGPVGLFSMSGHETRSTGTPKSGKNGCLCRDMKSGAQGLPSPEKFFVFRVRTWNPVQRDRFPCQDMKPGLQTPKSRECQDIKPGPEGLPSPLNTDSQNPAKLGSPCQDMKLGPWGLQVVIIYHYIGINTKQNLTGGG